MTLPKSSFDPAFIAPDQLLFQQADNVLVIRLNHPKSANPFSSTMAKGLIRKLREIEANPSIKAIVLYGGDGRSFCAGGDARDMAALHTDSDIKSYINETIDTHIALLSVTKPLLACIDGYCIGHGLQLALLADLRLGSDQSIYSMPELPKGIACPNGSLILEHMFGRAVMLNLLYENQKMSASEAKSIGLINDVISQQSLLQTATSKAKLLAHHPEIAVRETKRHYNSRFIALLEQHRNSAVLAHFNTIKSLRNPDVESA